MFLYFKNSSISWVLLNGLSASLMYIVVAISSTNVTMTKQWVKKDLPFSYIGLANKNTFALSSYARVVKRTNHEITFSESSVHRIFLRSIS